MQIKPGVRVRGIQPEILLAAMVCQSICQKHGVEFVITSVVDGKHMDNSLHYEGQAIDIRSREMQSPHIIVNEINNALGSDYDVVVEGDHIHIEYDPLV